MGMLRKVPDKLLAEICALSAEGKSAMYIIDWLKTNHNISVARKNIYRIVAEHKEERASAAKAAYANSAAQYANQDLNIISDIITKFKTKIDACLLKDDFVQANRLSQTLLNYIKTRLELSGLNVDKDKNEIDQINQIRDEWIKRLNEAK